MTRFEPEPSHAVRIGLAASCLPNEEIGPDSRTIAAAFERLWLAQREPAGDAAGDDSHAGKRQTSQTCAARRNVEAFN